MNIPPPMGSQVVITNPLSAFRGYIGTVLAIRQPTITMPETAVVDFLGTGHLVLSLDEIELASTVPPPNLSGARYHVGDPVAFEELENGIQVSYVGNIVAVHMSWPWAGGQPTATYSVTKSSGTIIKPEAALSPVAVHWRHDLSNVGGIDKASPPPRAEMPCPIRTCGKPNDVGVATCWNCGNRL